MTIERSETGHSEPTPGQPAPALDGPSRLRSLPGPASVESEVIKALRLAPNLETFEAIIRGEDVPLEALDPKWRKAYGLR